MPLLSLPEPCVSEPCVTEPRPQGAVLNLLRSVIGNGEPSGSPFSLPATPALTPEPLFVRCRAPGGSEPRVSEPHVSEPCVSEPRPSGSGSSRCYRAATVTEPPLLLSRVFQSRVFQSRVFQSRVFQSRVFQSRDRQGAVLALLPSCHCHRAATVTEPACFRAVCYGAATTGSGP
jgi:hypothetical protein